MAVVSSLKPFVASLRSIADLPANASFNPATSQKDLRSHFKITVIDDETFTHAERLHQLGFDIHYAKSLDNLNAAQVGQIFVCDIMGIDSDAKYDGVWTMSEIRRRHPVAPVIAYTFLKAVDKRYQEARRIAERVLRKSTEIDDLVDLLDGFIHELNSPRGIFVRIRKHLLEKGLDTKDVAVIEHFFVQSFIKDDPRIFKTNAPKIANAAVADLLTDAGAFLARSAVGGVIKAGTGAVF